MGARCGLASNQPNYGKYCSESATLRSQQNNDSCLQSSKKLFKTIPNENPPCTYSSSQFWKKPKKNKFWTISTKKQLGNFESHETKNDHLASLK